RELADRLALRRRLDERAEDLAGTAGALHARLAVLHLDRQFLVLVADPDGDRQPVPVLRRILVTPDGGRVPDGPRVRVLALVLRLTVFPRTRLGGHLHAGRVPVVLRRDLLQRPRLVGGHLRVVAGDRRELAALG